MKKILAIALAVLLIAAMAVPAYAVTPKYEFPDLPEIPDISDDVKFEIDIPDSFWDKWFQEHPIKLPTFKLPSEGLLNRLQGAFD